MRTPEEIAKEISQHLHGEDHAETILVISEAITQVRQESEAEMKLLREANDGVNDLNVELHHRNKESEARIKELEDQRDYMGERMNDYIEDRKLGDARISALEAALREACDILANAKIQAYAFKTQNDIGTFLTSEKIKNFLAPKDGAV
jgi:hypothetical protein